MEGEVLEGFLCPICYTDLKTAINLNSHFQDAHKDDQNLFKSVKDMYDKAKKKIRRSNVPGGSGSGSNEPEASNGVPRRIPGYLASDPLHADDVPWQSYTSRFMTIRSLRNERYSAQANILIIRLGKLLQQLPTDPVRRKAYEQEMVPWVDAKDVSLCPGCAKSFSIIRRKHHCRLCGAVMCKNCTFYLPLENARKIIGNTYGASATNAGKELVTSSPRSRLQTVQAVQSVLSIDGITDGDFLLCEHCHRLLAARELARQNKSERPIISQFYERMRAANEACEKAVTSYLMIYQSLREGESKYSLSEGKELRVEILRLAETIDGTSKKIAILGMNAEMPPEGAQLQLQQTIRNAAALYIKQNVITLPSLPTEEEVAEWQEIRRRNYERQIEEERKRQLEEEEEEARRSYQASVEESSSTMSSLSIGSSRSTPPPPKNLHKVVMQDSWTPSVQQAIISDDPLLQQIGILHGFIQQARLAGKLDECEALERNLAELQDHLDSRQAESQRS